LSDFDIRREDGATKGRWLVEVGGHVAEMTYSRTNPSLIIVDHTEIPDGLRGRGVGQALARNAVETARREGFKIMPLCPFLRSQFEKNPDWADVRLG
jgi:hypothetical protein